MKKLLGIILAAMLLVTATAAMVSADGISVVVNDKQVEFDVQPQIIEERTMVPLRAIFEALGATVEWDDATKTVSSELGGVKISLAIGSNQLYVNGTAKEIDVPAMILEERTMVPVRAISEAFGCEVGWDGDTKTVSITMKQPEPEKKPVEIEEVEGAIITRADAEEGSEKYVLVASSGKLETVEDSDKEGNHVYKNTCLVNDKNVWTYVWYNTEFKAGQKYIVEYDCKVISDVFGDEVTSKCFIGTCFQYATETEATKDHGVGGANFEKGGEWAHVKLIYTVPNDYKAGGARFGIYANPVDKEGYDFKAGLSYELDNISVIPYDGDAPDGVLNSSSETVVKDFDYENAKGTVYDFDSSNDGWIASGCSAEAKDGILVLTAKEGNNDPQITLKDISVDASKYDKVLVRFKYKNDVSTDRCNAFFATDSEPALNEAKCSYVTYSSGHVDEEGYTWILFDYSGNTSWKGTVNTLRFDPAHSANGTYEIDKIIIVEK